LHEALAVYESSPGRCADVSTDPAEKVVCGNRL